MAVDTHDIMDAALLAMLHVASEDQGDGELSDHGWATIQAILDEVEEPAPLGVEIGQRRISRSVEQALREDGFTGQITDRKGRKIRYVNGRRVKGKAARASMGKSDGGDSAGDRAKLAATVAKAKEQLAADIKQMAATPEGKSKLAKARELVAETKQKITEGVKKAVEGIDAESGGGLSMIAGSLKGRDPVAAAAGVSRITSTIFTCVHEEMFGLLLSQQTGGPALAAKLTAKGVAKVAALAETGVMKAAVWAWGKVRGTGEAIDWTLLEAEMERLTDADKQLLAELAKLTAAAMQEMLGSLGVEAEDVEIDQSKLAQRLASLLTSER